MGPPTTLDGSSGAGGDWACAGATRTAASAAPRAMPCLMNRRREGEGRSGCGAEGFMVASLLRRKRVLRVRYAFRRPLSTGSSTAADAIPADTIAPPAAGRRLVVDDLLKTSDMAAPV